MHTKRRFHLPNREWSKVIRFNGVDYLLSSLFDRDFDFGTEYKKSLDFDFDDEYEKEQSRKNRLFKKTPKLNHRVVEDFFDDFDLDNEEGIGEVSVLDDYNFIINTKDGETVEVSSSKDPIKNRIFGTLVQLIVVDNPSGSLDNVDKFIKKVGENAYMMKISEILYEDGCIRFEVMDSTNLSSYLKIFSTDGLDTKIMLKGYNRIISRQRSHDLVVMDNQQFKDIIKYDVTYDEKDMVEYYMMLLGLLKKFFTSTGSLTLCRQTGSINQLNQSEDVDFLKNNFKIVSKLSKLKSDPQWDDKMKKVLMMNKDFISKMYSDGEKQITSSVGDEFYVMIGGTDKFVKDFINSGFFKYEVFRGCWCIVTKVDTDPNVITKELVTKVCLVPFSKFMYALPALYMYCI